MGTKSAKGSITIEQKENRIRLRWRFQTKRYSLNLFEFSKSNILLAKKIAQHIGHDINIGKFDSTLYSYKPNYCRKIVETPEENLVQIFETWVTNYRNMDCNTDKDYHTVRNMMLRWGRFDITSVLYHFNQETFSAKTYNRRLSLLNSFFKWTTKSKLTEENPLEDVLPKKAKKIEIASRKPFSVDEIRLILNAFKNNTFSNSCSGYSHSHYFPFIYFMFKTGVRNAEAVGLRAKNIDFKNNLIYINEVLARTIKGTNAGCRIRKNTKNDKEVLLTLIQTQWTKWNGRVWVTFHQRFLKKLQHKKCLIHSKNKPKRQVTNGQRKVIT